jgi:hypothetical protein
MNSPEKITKILMLILVIFSILLFVKLLYFGYNLLNYPYQWEVSEASQLNQARILSEGKPFYSINKEPPIAVNYFGPVNPLIIAPLLKVFGVNFFTPRLVSFASFLLLQLFTAYAVYSLTKNWKFIFLSSGLFTFMSHWWQWLLIGRPDSLGAFLLFLTIFLHWKFPYNKKAVALSLLTGLAAFFTKIYFVSGFCSIVLSYWFTHRDKKMAISYLIYSSSLLIMSVLIMNYVTDGIYYLFTFRIGPMWTRNSLDFLLNVNLKSLIFFYAPLFVLILHAVLRKSLDYKRYGVFFTHLLLGFPLTSYLCLNVGGGPYYWYTILPVLIIIGCDLIYQESKKPISNIIAPALLIILFLMIFKAGYKDILMNDLVIPSPELAQRWKPLQDLVRSAKNDVMNDDSTAILNIHAGKELFSDGLGYSRNRDYLKNKHNYSFIDISKKIAQKNYDYILNPEDALESDVMKHYILFKTFFVPAQFGRWNYKINVFIPKNDEVGTNTGKVF